MAEELASAGELQDLEGYLKSKGYTTIKISALLISYLTVVVQYMLNESQNQIERDQIQRYVLNISKLLLKTVGLLKK